jgi:hypothetical protein
MDKDCSNIDKVVSCEKMHKSKKGVIAGRVQVLRVLIIQYYKDKRYKYTEYDFLRHCEAVLDNTLAKYEYDIEHLICSWMNMTPSLFKEYPVTCHNCGYRPPFCGCHLS